MAQGKRTILGGNDAVARVGQARIPSQEVVFGGQVVAAAGVAVNTSGVITTGNATTPTGASVIAGNFGNPRNITLYLHADVGATFAISYSHDGAQYFHDTTSDVVLTAGQDKVVQIIGGQFIKVVPSVAQTAMWVVATASY